MIELLVHFLLHTSPFSIRVYLQFATDYMQRLDLAQSSWPTVDW